MGFKLICHYSNWFQREPPLRLGAAGGVMGAVGIYTGAFIAYFGGTAGISVLFGSVGAGLTGWRVARRTAVGTRCKLSFVC